MTGNDFDCPLNRFLLGPPGQGPFYQLNLYRYSEIEQGGGPIRTGTYWVVDMMTLLSQTAFKGLMWEQMQPWDLKLDVICALRLEGTDGHEVQLVHFLS